MKNKIILQAKIAKEAALKLASAAAEQKNSALELMAEAIVKNKKEILEANRQDLKNAEKSNLKKALVDRLKLDNSKIEDMRNESLAVSKLQDPIGKTISAIELDKGLNLSQITTPIGVIGAIFESRPDVVAQISALCIKSGNAVILKGGSEAINTNRTLVKVLSEAAENGKLPNGCIQAIETREDVRELLKFNDYIDLIIPRGSKSFVEYIKENTKIPVLGHSDGICHVYVDKDADLKKAIDICFDSKCQYPAVCNAMETLLVCRSVSKDFLPEMISKFQKAGVELRGDNATKKINPKIKDASEEDWKTEYNDLILSIKIVDSLNEAIDHINKYGSKHTDAIVTENNEAAKEFIKNVDSSSVMINASTRFADGFRYGKGAEVGINTGKIHSRGPVGIEGLIIYKYVLEGNGQVVSTYSGPKAKKFTHRKIK